MTYSSITERHKPTQGSDLYTRLSIAMYEGDDGVRPVDTVAHPNVVGWKSPAFEFSEFPIPAAVPVTINLAISNFGTMDATNVMIEFAYNIYLGNENQGMEQIGNKLVPMIPSGGTLSVGAEWTPPDTDATHGCVHARAFDTFSWTNYPARNLLWSSWDNPQAGNRNVRLVPIVEEDAAIFVPFKAKQFDGHEARIIVTRVDGRRRAGTQDDPVSNRFAALGERFPLPFEVSPPHVRTPATRFNALPAGTESLRSSTGARLPLPNDEGLWPQPDVAEHLRNHADFGFVPVSEKYVGRQGHKLAPFTRKTQPFALKPFEEFDLKRDKIQMLYLVVPPSEFPKPGRRRTLQIDYQVGRARPTQHFVVLAR